MPERILAEKALQQIDTIIHALIAHHDDFPPIIQTLIEQWYETMRADYAAATFGYQHAAIVVRFLEALDATPQVRDRIGSVIDSTKGWRMRGVIESSDPALLDRLPQTLSSPRTTSSAPPPAAPAPSIPSPPSLSPSRDLGSATSIGSGSATREVETMPESAKSIVGSTSALTRYPEVEYPSEVLIGARTSLIVCLLLEPPDPATTPIAIADALPDELPEVEVVIRSRGFDLVGSNTQVLQVSRDEDCDVRFVLIPRLAGQQTIRVDFYQNDRRIGSVQRQVMVVAEERTLPPPLTQPPIELLEFAPGDVAPPDLELCVETDPDDERVLYFTLHSSSEALDYHHARMGHVRLQGTPLEKLQSVYDELSKFAGATPRDPDTADYQRRRLASLGWLLWDELFPKDLKDAYWQFRQSAKTLLITSDEPWIPWEIVKPYRFDDENTRWDEPHLCEQFNVARWLSGPGMVEKMQIRRIRPVAPLEVDLPSVQAELRYLGRISDLWPDLVPDVPYNDRGRVIDLFENGAFNVLHVAAHGNFDSRMPSNSGIGLTGGLLRPSDIAARFGGNRPRPLVFINACHGARVAYTFTGLGGWADRLVRHAKVGAFIGASWEVNDQLALRFAEAFYAALLRDRKTIGESFRVARETIRDAAPANSTWLAYVLYADPEARVVV